MAQSGAELLDKIKAEGGRQVDKRGDKEAWEFEGKIFRLSRGNAPVSIVGDYTKVFHGLLKKKQQREVRERRKKAEQDQKKATSTPIPPAVSPVAVFNPVLSPEKLLAQLKAADPTPTPPKPTAQPKRTRGSTEERLEWAIEFLRKHSDRYWTVQELLLAMPAELRGSWEGARQILRVQLAAQKEIQSFKDTQGLHCQWKPQPSEEKTPFKPQGLPADLISEIRQAIATNNEAMCWIALGHVLDWHSLTTETA